MAVTSSKSFSQRTQFSSTKTVEPHKFLLFLCQSKLIETMKPREKKETQCRVDSNLIPVLSRKKAISKGRKTGELQRLTGFFRRTVRSTTDTSGTGTRNAIPVSFLQAQSKQRCPDLECQAAPSYKTHTTHTQFCARRSSTPHYDKDHV